MAEISVLVVEPGKEPRLAQTENTVEAFEKLIGGSPDFGCFMPEKVMLISNASDAAHGARPNRANPRGNEYLFGTFLLCGIGEDFSSLTEEQIAYFRGYFKKPGKLELVTSEEMLSALMQLAFAADGFLTKLENGDAYLVDQSQKNGEFAGFKADRDSRQKYSMIR